MTGPRSDPLTALRRALPEGTAVVALGLLVSGVTTYAYLVLTARAVGPERYAAVSALWAITVLGALGVFIPLEQEVARAISARRALGTGARPVLERGIPAAAALAGGLVLLAAAASGVLRSQLFDGSWVLLGSFAAALVAYAGVHLLRGVLSGTGRFAGYGLLMGSEGVIRLVGCVALVVAGVDTPGPYGIVLAGGAALAVVLVLAVERRVLEPGPPASMAELATALGHLLAGSVLAQILLNGPPLAVKLLAQRHEHAIAGRFLAGLVVARVPLFLSAALQAALLPRLSGLVAAGRGAEFRAFLGRLLLVLSGLGVVSTVAAVAVGPPLVRLLFGSAFDLRAVDLGLLAAASGLYLLAVVLAQALIAGGAQPRVTAGWAAGVAGFALALVPSQALVTRVEVAFLVGSAVAAAAMGGLLLRTMPDEGVVPPVVVDPPLAVDPLEP